MRRLPLVSPLDRMIFLRAQPYLEGVPSDVVSVLASFTEEEFHPAESWVRRSGKPVDRILFLAEGTVEVARGRAEPIVVEAPGAVGLVHYFAGVEDAPAVRATEDTLALSIDVVDLEAILEDHFPLLHRFATRGGEELTELLRVLGPARPDEVGFDTRSETPLELDLVHRLAAARRAPFLRGANLTMLGELIRFDDVELVEAGEAVWSPGDPVDRMALVMDGCFVSSDAAARAPAGAVLGNWDVLSDGQRVDGWVASNPSRVLWIRRELFADLLEDHYELAVDYLQQQSQRIIEAWALGGEPA